jgi:hypothetical protein
MINDIDYLATGAVTDRDLAFKTALHRVYRERHFNTYAVEVLFKEILIGVTEEDVNWLREELAQSGIQRLVNSKRDARSRIDYYPPNPVDEAPLRKFVRHMTGDVQCSPKAQVEIDGFIRLIAKIGTKGPMFEFRPVNAPYFWPLAIMSRTPQVLIATGMCFYPGYMTLETCHLRKAKAGYIGNFPVQPSRINY